MNFYDDYNYIPEKLPCGKNVNKRWKVGKPLSCCKTVCYNKCNEEIETCYSVGGHLTGSGRFLA